jgi:hypothetical protein
MTMKKWLISFHVHNQLAHFNRKKSAQAHTVGGIVRITKLCFQGTVSCVNLKLDLKV